MSYAVDLDKLSTSIKNLKKIQNELPKKEKVTSKKGAGSSKKQIDAYIKEMEKCGDEFETLLTNTIKCLEKFKSTVKNNDTKAAVKVKQK